jgi:hypothetical protein
METAFPRAEPQPVLSATLKTETKEMSKVAMKKACVKSRKSQTEQQTLSL